MAGRMCTAARGGVSNMKHVMSAFSGLQLDASNRCVPISLPQCPSYGNLKITVPSVDKLCPILEPSTSLLLDKCEPNTAIVPKIAPAHEISGIAKRAARKLQIRRRRMRLHKLRKLYRRDHHQILTRRREKEAAAEKSFRTEMMAIMHQADNFDPKAYVQDVLEKCRWKPEHRAPTGRKIYPHWTEIMTIEDLYKLPKTDYIDKRAGFAEEEDWEEIQKLRDRYASEWADVNQSKKKQ